MSDGMGRESAYLSSHATNRYFIPNWGTIMLRSWGSTRADRTLILLSLASAATNRSPMAGIGAAWTAPVVAAPIRAAISEW